MSAAMTTYQARCGHTGHYQRFTAYGTPQENPYQAAESLREALQRAGAYSSEVSGLLHDLADGHVLTMDNGKVFQVVPQCLGSTATVRELVTLRRIQDGLIQITPQAASDRLTAFHFIDVLGDRHSCGVIARAMWSAGYFNVLGTAVGSPGGSNAGGRMVVTEAGLMLLRQHWTPKLEDRYAREYRYLNLPDSV